MKPKIRLPLEMCSTIEGLCDKYEEAYGVCIPDFAFFEMIVNLGIDYMRSMLEGKVSGSEQ